ncbi:hypothetical protein [Nonomuraea typhae]|uniref:hypothetical protein n=1 Tax=Nonomuraea typhae TaxID=2603600 RepID=UPI0012F9310F|nr:hypothetical protein [Nonomuraea typhae]
MQTAVIILIYVVMAAAILIGVLISDRRGLKESLKQARADRNEAWERNRKLHEERLADLQRNTVRVNEMTERLRNLNSSYTGPKED